MIGIIIFTITGLLLSIPLVILDNKLKEENKIEKYLPGYNCGACGFGSCEGMKEKILEDKMNYKKCKFIKNGEAIEYFEKL